MSAPLPAELLSLKAEIAAGAAAAQKLFDLAESLIAENRRLLETRDEYAAVIARQRGAILRQARLIGRTPSSQLHLHADPLLQARFREDDSDEGCPD